VGYAGWAPRQLQGEVERDSWFLASADSGTLLKELLRQGTELPPPSTGALPGDGLATWETLMTSIGRSEEVARTAGSLADRMLSEWCRIRLVPPSAKVEEAQATRDQAAVHAGGPNDRERKTPVAVGTVLRTGSPSDRALLSDQFLHKALLLTVHELKEGLCVATVLNRPTANIVQFHADGEPRRCISFGGDGRLRGGGLGVDSNGLMWLCQAATPAAESIGTAVGSSGLRRVPAEEAATAIKEGLLSLSDFLLISGLVCFESQELAGMLEAEELHVVEDARPVWPQVWGLADASNVELQSTSDEDGALLSDGTGAWWAAALLEKSRGIGAPSATPPPEGIDALLTGLQAMPPAPHIADEALAEWLKFFAGHRPHDIDD
jgi:hypothetical protein